MQERSGAASAGKTTESVASTVHLRSARSVSSVVSYKCSQYRRDGNHRGASVVTIPDQLVMKFMTRHLRSIAAIRKRLKIPRILPVLSKALNRSVHTFRAGLRTLCGNDPFHVFLPIGKGEGVEKRFIGFIFLQSRCEVLGQTDNLLLRVDPIEDFADLCGFRVFLTVRIRFDPRSKRRPGFIEGDQTQPLEIGYFQESVPALLSSQVRLNFRSPLRIEDPQNHPVLQKAHDSLQLFLQLRAVRDEPMELSGAARVRNNRGAAGKRSQRACVVARSVDRKD